MKKLFYILLFVPLALFGQISTQVGDTLQGGIVFYIHPTEGYGLISSIEDLPVGYEWGTTGQYIDGTGMDIGEGELNTDIISSYSFESGANYVNIPDISAATACYQFTVDSFSDWYLPSILELVLLYESGNLSPTVNIDSFPNGNQQEYYWSSTQYDSTDSFYNSNHAYGFNSSSNEILSGTYRERGKSDISRVRPISKFYLIAGCTDTLYVEYNPFAEFDDGSCQITLEQQFYMEMVDTLQILNQNLVEESTLLQNEFNDLESESIASLSSLQQALDTWNTTIDLSAGWNMFGYGCPSSIDVAEGLSNNTESIIITKDNNGNVYMPEFGFNGIGDFTPGFGYQIKLTEAIEGFSLCDWYVNDIPEDNIVYLQEENAVLTEEVDSLQEELESLIEESILLIEDNLILQAELDSINSVGCTDSVACNFDIFHNIEDGSCEYNIDGYDCDGNLIAEIGDVIQGGILFYINNNNGKVVTSYDPCTYCSWPNANQTAENLTIGGYDDWYLPTHEEYILMYNSVGPGSLIGNVAEFGDTYYWSSSDNGNESVSIHNLFSGHVSGNSIWNSYRASRAVRSF